MLDQSLRGKELAPHEFVQTYTADYQWGVIRGRYSLLGIDMESEAGIAPQETNHASDVDTLPVGTALGIRTLWLLLPAQSEQEYRRLARAA